MLGNLFRADVSVIIPCYNSENTIELCLLSVANQNLPVNEVIVVDDASQDGDFIRKVVNDFGGRLRIKLHRNEKNLGASYSRNAGLSLATSKYVAFLDSDDVWHPDKVLIQYKFMCDHAVRMSGHGYIFNFNSQGFPKFLSDKFRIICKGDFLAGNILYTPTIMVERVGFVCFDETLPRMEDYKCWIENIGSGRAVLLEAEMAAGFKSPLGDSGLSASISKMHRGYVTALFSLHQQGNISFIFFCAALVFEYFKYPLRYLRCYLNVLRK